MQPAHRSAGRLRLPIAISVSDLEELRQLVRQAGEPCTIEFIRTKHWSCQDPAVSARLIIINSIADDLVPYLGQC